MVYLDNNATTPVDPRVAELVSDVLRQTPGNPSSATHLTGRLAAQLVDDARHKVAETLSASHQSVIFTSGATEAIHLAFLGLALSARGTRINFVIAATEHKAVIKSAELAARITGGEVRRAKVDREGHVDLDHLASISDESVTAIAVMLANNETGAINRATPIQAVAGSVGAHLICDATQAVGKTSVELDIAASDIAVLSSHKLYGPKGAGALIVNRHLQKHLTPVLAGGGQERGLRGGTHNVPGIAGFGLAAQLVSKEGESDRERIGALSEQLLDDLTSRLQSDGLGKPRLNGPVDERIKNTLNLRFVGADAEAVIASAPGVEISTGSACQSAVTTPSHVLTAMGLDPKAASECVRISLGRFTTNNDVQYAAKELADAIVRVDESTEPRETQHGA